MTKYMTAAGVLALCILSSCDNIDEQDRFIPVERPDISRVVLVQEFTGMNCINCPAGQAVLHSVQESFPESVIIVGLHPQNNPNTLPIGGLNLTSPEATAYFDYYKPDGFPAALVDGGNLSTSTATWNTSILNDMAVPAPLDLHVSTTYDEATRELQADYEIVFNQVYSENLSISLWIIENGITGFQQSPNGYIRYVHNHVLRTSINGTWGEEIGASFVTEQVVSGNGSITLPSNWVAENCEIVAFVAKTGNKTVEQAAITTVIPATEEPEE